MLAHCQLVKFVERKSYLEPSQGCSPRHNTMYGVCRRCVGTLWVTLGWTYTLYYVSKYDVQAEDTTKPYRSVSDKIGKYRHIHTKH